MKARTRIAAVTAAAITALSLLMPSAAFAADEAPEPPARSELTAENAGSAGAEQQGPRVTVTTGVDAEEVYVVVYPADAEPVAVGWQQPADGSFDVDLSLMPAGETAVALLDAEGEVLGWASTELAEDDSHAAPPEDPQPSAESAAPVWPWLFGGGALVVLIAAGIVLFRKRASKSGPHERDADVEPAGEEAAPDSETEAGPKEEPEA